MTELEFKQIMQGAGYENFEPATWRYKKFEQSDFLVWDIHNEDKIDLSFEICVRGSDMILSWWHYTFETVSQMNSIEFKKKLEGMTEYAYSLYMDINRHIDGIAKKLETKAQRLGL